MIDPLDEAREDADRIKRAQEASEAWARVRFRKLIVEARHEFMWSLEQLFPIVFSTHDRWA